MDLIDAIDKDVPYTWLWALLKPETGPWTSHRIVHIMRCLPDAFLINFVFIVTHAGYKLTAPAL